MYFWVTSQIAQPIWHIKVHQGKSSFAGCLVSLKNLRRGKLFYDPLFPMKIQKRMHKLETSFSKDIMELMWHSVSSYNSNSWKNINGFIDFDIMKAENDNKPFFPSTNVWITSK